MKVVKTPRHMHKPKYQVFLTEAEIDLMIQTDFFNHNTFTGVFTELRILLSQLKAKEKHNG